MTSIPLQRRLAGLLVLSVLCGCSTRRPAAPLVVFAAASMGPAMQEIAAAFEKEHETRVNVSADATGGLRKQIELGAPCDVFVSADAEQMDKLEVAGRLAPGSRRDVAANALVIIAADVNTPVWDHPRRLLDPDINRIALANPEYAPAGRYAKLALQRRGLWRRLRSKTVFVDDVKLALRHVRMGAAPCGIVYRSDATGISDCKVVFVFDEADHPPIRYPAAVIRRERPHPLAEAFREFLVGEAAQAILQQHGFTRLHGFTSVMLSEAKHLLPLPLRERVGVRVTPARLRIVLSQGTLEILRFAQNDTGFAQNDTGFAQNDTAFAQNDTRARRVMLSAAKHLNAAREAPP